MDARLNAGGHASPEASILDPAIRTRASSPELHVTSCWAPAQSCARRSFTASVFAARGNGPARCHQQAAPLHARTLLSRRPDAPPALPGRLRPNASRTPPKRGGTRRRADASARAGARAHRRRLRRRTAATTPPRRAHAPRARWGCPRCAAPAPSTGCARARAGHVRAGRGTAPAAARRRRRLRNPRPHRSRPAPPSARARPRPRPCACRGRENSPPSFSSKKRAAPQHCVGAPQGKASLLPEMVLFRGLLARIRPSESHSPCHDP